MEFKAVIAMGKISIPLPVLFLDTPRGPEELNHIYLVASATRAPESMLVDYSNLARQNIVRNDYIAIRRAVKQVSRGQVREGEELLILCNIDLSGLHNPEPLRARLGEILDALQGPMQIDERQGMLVSSPLIQRFESELSSRRDVRPAKATTPNPNHPAVMKYAWIPIIIAIVLLLFWRNGPSPKGASPNPQPSGQVETPGIPPSSDWAFLNDQNWVVFAGMTGLPPNSQDAQRQEWAEMILAEFAAGNSDHDQPLSSLVKSSKQIGEVLDIVSQQPVEIDGLAISLKWLDYERQERLQLREFFQALNDMPGPAPSPAQLKGVIRTWWEAVAEFTSNEPSILGSEARENLRIRPYEEDNPVAFLTEVDLRRLHFLSEYLNGQAFLDKLSAFDSTNDDGWQSADWSEKFNKLGSLSKDGNFDDSTQNSPRILFEKLNRSISPYLK